MDLSAINLGLIEHLFNNMELYGHRLFPGESFNIDFDIKSIVKALQPLEIMYINKGHYPLLKYRIVH